MISSQYLLLKVGTGRGYNYKIGLGKGGGGVTRRTVDGNQQERRECKNTSGLL